MYPVSVFRLVGVVIPLIRHLVPDVRVVVHQQDTIRAKLVISPRAHGRKRDQCESEEAEEPAENAAVFHGHLLSVLKVFMSVSPALAGQAPLYKLSCQHPWQSIPSPFEGIVRLSVAKIVAYFSSPVARFFRGRKFFCG